MFMLLIDLLCRESLYKMNFPVLYTKLEGEMLNPTKSSTIILLLPNNKNSIIKIINKSLYLMREIDNIIFYHINEDNNDNTKNILEELIEEMKERNLNINIDIEKIDESYTIEEQIINYLSHNQSIGVICIGNHLKEVNEKNSFDVCYSKSEYIVRYCRSHILVIKV